MPTGRRDGSVSSASEVSNNLPSPLESVATHRKKFAAKGLDDNDLVTLVGIFSRRYLYQTSCINIISLIEHI